MTTMTWIRNLGSISKEEDLKLRPGININPPPSDGRCDCCGRHLSKLKSFGKPCVGEYDDALLVKRFRWDAPPDEEIDKIMEEFFGACCSSEDYEKARNKLIEKYGQEEAEEMMMYQQLSRTASKSWECRDCFYLSTKRFYRVQSNIFYGKLNKPDGAI